MKTEEKYLDVLQNIEFAIADAYKNDRTLSNYNVMSALEALIETYVAQIKGSVLKSYKLSPQEQTLFEGIKEMCEWRLGRGSLSEMMGKRSVDVDKISVEEIIHCIRKVLKSVNFWNREGGRQGYLDFIVKYF